MDTALDTKRAAVYARISQDDAGTEKGVTRQLDDARQLATLRGFEVVGEYVENDVSAFAHRPQYERLMADAAAGGFDVIVVYSTSRLWRNRTQRGAAIDTLGRLGVTIEAVSGPSLDLGSATGRYLADVIAGGDTRESEEKGERVSRAARQRAEEGRANGACPYGWRRVYDHDERGRVIGFDDEEDPEAAPVVREIVQRLGAGESIRAVARDLTARGIPTATGLEAWGHSSVRRLALRPGNVGKRTANTRTVPGKDRAPWRGDIIGDAEWPAIVDEADWWRVVDRLGDPERRARPQLVSAKPGHLLTGLSGAGRCGVCDGPLQVKRRRRPRKRGPDVTYVHYACQKQRACVGRNRDNVDDLTTAVVLARLSKPDAVRAFDHEPGDAETPAALALDLRDKLDQAAQSYADGRTTLAQLETITATLQPRIDAADAEARAALTPPPEPPPALDLLAHADRVEDVWEGLTLDDRRAVLAALGLRVRIMPTRPGPGFEPTDIHFEWNWKGES